MIMIRLFVLPVLIMHCSVPSVLLFSADIPVRHSTTVAVHPDGGTTDGGQAVRPRVRYFLL